MATDRNYLREIYLQTVDPGTKRRVCSVCGPVHDPNLLKTTKFDGQGQSRRTRKYCRKTQDFKKGGGRRDGREQTRRTPITSTNIGFQPKGGQTRRARADATDPENIEKYRISAKRGTAEQTRWTPTNFEKYRISTKRGANATDQSRRDGPRN